MLEIAGKKLQSRLFVGSALYPSPEIMLQSIKASRAEIVTIALRRQSPNQQAGKRFWDLIKSLNLNLLPNTAGCRTANEAVTVSKMARDLFETNWIKLEVIGDDYNLQPDPFGLVEAAGQLVKDGFEVLPYTTDDLVLAKRLIEVGCKILMPWGSPIGSGQGLLNKHALQTLRARFPNIPIIIDAGIGKPSHAAEAMELGFDGILLNTAIALAKEPVKMAEAFAKAIEAGRAAYEAGLMPKRDFASPSTPLLGTPFWHHGDGPKGDTPGTHR